MNRLPVIGAATASGASHRTGGFPVAPAAHNALTVAASAEALPLFYRPWRRHGQGGYRHGTAQEYDVYVKVMQRTATQPAPFDAGPRAVDRFTHGYRPPVAMLWRMARSVTGSPNAQDAEAHMLRHSWGRDVLILSLNDEDADRPLIRVLQSVGIQPVLPTDRSALLRLWRRGPPAPPAARTAIDAYLTTMLIPYELSGCRTAILPQPELIAWDWPPPVRMRFIDATAQPLLRRGALALV